jgi:plastocyanin
MTRSLFVVLAVVALHAAACAGQQARPSGQGMAGPTEVQVHAEEYKFGGVPETLPAGTATFTLENLGKQPHDFGLVRIVGDTTAEELIQLPPNGADELIEDVGHAFARPGKTDTLEVTLEPGQYGYSCFVEAPDGKPHALHGMFGDFAVEEV